VKHLGDFLLAASLGCADIAKADCTPENWKDCKGKPWVTGDSETRP
jgi:hypothetical protein